MKRKYLLLAFLFLALCGIGIGLYLFNKPSPKASDIKPAFTLTATELAKAFESDGTQAGKLYAGKVLQVSGKVSDVKKDDKGLLTLVIEGTPGSAVSGVLQDLPKEEVKKGDEVTIKGFCSGFDDLFGEVQLHSCGIVK